MIRIVFGIALIHCFFFLWILAMAIADPGSFARNAWAVFEVEWGIAGTALVFLLAGFLLLLPPRIWRGK